MKTTIKLSKEQHAFIGMEKKFRAFVAGYGSGKSFVGSASIAKHALDYPGINQGFFAPTYPQIRDIFYPTISEVVELFGCSCSINYGNKEVAIYSGQRYLSTVICRSMERPETIIGFKIGNALIDEFDVLKKEKAMLAWKKIIARMRYKVDGVLNRIDVTTTPEGFLATHKLFVEDIEEKPELAGNYGIVHASTRSNAVNLPEDYIPSLLEAYPAELVMAYVDGQFCNLTVGSVYPAYNRIENRSNEVYLEGEKLYIGMDFNVGNMSAIVHVLRDGQPHAINEVCDLMDTPAMIKGLRNIYKTGRIYVFPDATGGSADTRNASESDISLLEAAGFIIDAPKANPRIRARVVSMNAMFCDATGKRKYKVNDKLCPKYANDLEQQSYGNDGKPDKAQGKDHRPDAAGYFIHRRFPAKRPLSLI